MRTCARRYGEVFPKYADVYVGVCLWKESPGQVGGQAVTKEVFFFFFLISLSTSNERRAYGRTWFHGIKCNYKRIESITRRHFINCNLQSLTNLSWHLMTNVRACVCTVYRSISMWTVIVLVVSPLYTSTVDLKRSSDDFPALIEGLQRK